MSSNGNDGNGGRTNSSGSGDGDGDSSGDGDGDSTGDGDGDSSGDGDGDSGGDGDGDSTGDGDGDGGSTGAGSNAQGPYGVNTQGECRLVEGQIEDGLQGECGKRCEEATRTKVASCAPDDDDCVTDAYLSDPTETIEVEWTVLIDLQTNDLNCDMCTLAQNISCQYELCASEASSFDNCIIFAITEEELNQCRRFEENLDDCLAKEQEGFETCKLVREGACFDPPK